MSKIQEKLDSLQPYVVGIRYLHGMQIVDAVFKEGWSVPTSDTIKKEFVDEAQNYYMFYTEKEGVTIDDLLEYVEGIIGVNIEREKKYELLKLKVNELKKLFKENSLTKLETLKFSFNEPTVMPSLGEMDEFDLEEEEPIETEIKIEVVTEDVVKNETTEETTEKDEKNDTKTNIANVKGQKVELPPKNEKIVVEEYEVPKIVCKCGPGEVCPVCEEEKMEKTY
jgi:hypothetical protein